MLKKIKDIYYKELFLYGFYITFISLTFIAMIIDFFINNHRDAIVDFIAVSIASLSFYFYLIKNKNFDLASITLFWITAGVIFLFLIQNKFDISIIFTLLIPLVGFILLSTSKAIFHIGIYFIFLCIIFIYGYMLFDTHPLLYNVKHMSAYIIALFFVIAFGVVYHIAIERSYHELELANKQKTFLIKEIHHRVKNNLNIIASILGIQRLESDSTEVHKIIDQNRLRLESMAMAHEILYQCDSLVNIDFKLYIEKLSKHILKTESQNNTIKVFIKIPPLSLNIGTMIQFGMIVNELMTNSIKYAFSNQNGEIIISLIKEKDGYSFSYSDNGKGFTPNSSDKGFGHSLIEMSIEQLDGELTIINENGLHYYILLKGLEDENFNC